MSRSICQLCLYVDLLLVDDYCLLTCVLAACASEDLGSSEEVVLILHDGAPLQFVS